MEKSEIESRVKTVIANVLRADAATLTPETNFIFDLGADSQQSVQLVCALEEEFEVEMPMEQASEIQNVASAIDFVDSLVNS